MDFRDLSSHIIFNHFNPAWPGEPWQLHRLLDCCFLRWCCHQPWRPQRPKPPCWTLQTASCLGDRFWGKEENVLLLCTLPKHRRFFEPQTPICLFTSERGHGMFLSKAQASTSPSSLQWLLHEDLHPLWQWCSSQCRPASHVDFELWPTG